MSKLIDMTGKRFGRLTANKIDTDNTTGAVKWICTCDCGNTTSVFGKNLRTGHTKSCGCLSTEVHTKHNMHGTPIYGVWQAMIRRCNDPKNKQYKDYGDRGISVCKEWLSFECFYLDMGDSNGLTIERKNNDGNYSKQNCKWASRKEQQNNKRNNRLIEYKGITKSVSLLAEEFGLKYITLISRLNNGWDVEDALTRRVR